MLGSSHFFIAITGKEYPAHPTYSKVCPVEKPQETNPGPVVNLWRKNRFNRC